MKQILILNTGGTLSSVIKQQGMAPGISTAEITDKIEVIIFADGNASVEIAPALDVYKEYVSAQTLALSIEMEDLANAPEGAACVEWDEGVLRMVLKRI